MSLKPISESYAAGCMAEQQLIIYNLERVAVLIAKGNPPDLVIEVEIRKWNERLKATKDQADKERVI